MFKLVVDTLILARVFIKVPQPGASEVNFLVLYVVRMVLTSCHDLLIPF